MLWLLSAGPPPVRGKNRVPFPKSSPVIDFSICAHVGRVGGSVGRWVFALAVFVCGLARERSRRLLLLACISGVSCTPLLEAVRAFPSELRQQRTGLPAVFTWHFPPLSFSLCYRTSSLGQTAQSGGLACLRARGMCWQLGSGQGNRGQVLLLWLSRNKRRGFETIWPAVICREVK